ncbi:MAG: GNAT family N-acetyltransferase [Acidimicrobiia bacterium]|nr:GNAT family N-acetyltransferase [Acidimicrobiia bacterium]MDH4305948.1 GNAT family N-acetyltransferase [Acidimicrobiia bacterium]MDH5293760.1 GNAT family N-acetyltransferase [Acidimicrobiia bacterium]
MRYLVRRAQAPDLDHIALFTTDTFVWGDYVAAEFPEWLGDPAGVAHVAETPSGDVIGVLRTIMLADREAWHHGARVHPDHRRSGVASELYAAGSSWARSRGALIERLMVEDWNESAGAQVRALGFRHVAPWMSAVLAVGSEVLPTTNGGRRVAGEERLAPARSADTDVAWMAWSSSDVARRGRELFSWGWHFRRMTVIDVHDAATQRSLWHCPSGWVMARLDENGLLCVPWMATSDLDIARLLRAVIDLADGLRAERIRVLSPRIEWIEEAATRAGFALTPSHIYARSD